MRRKPGETAQNAGRRFESFWASLFGTKPQPGSGNQWTAKLDVADGSITWSLKWTEKDNHSISTKLLREADNAIYSNGDNSLPGLAISLDDGGEVVVVLRAEDFIRLMSTAENRYIEPSKSEQKRHISAIPSLLRESS